MDVCRYVIQRMQNEAVRKQLLKLYPGEPQDKLLEKYYREKIKLTGIVCLAGCCLGCCLSFSDQLKGVLDSSAGIQRTEKEFEVVLQAEFCTDDKKVREEIVINVEPQILTRDIAERRLDELIKELDVLIKGENESLQFVSQNLYLPEEVEGYPFGIQWKSSDRNLVSEDGAVHVEDLGENVCVQLQGIFSYGEYEWEYSWDVMMYPPARNAEEQIGYILRKRIKQEIEEQQFDNKFTLPEEVDGLKIDWKEKREHRGIVAMGISLVTGIAIFYAKDKDLEKQLEQRKQTIRKEYTSLVSKYALLMEAGLTVRGAFFKIYNDTCGQDIIKRHPLYEEMRYSCNEMRAGISENKVLEDFARRIDVPEYAKFSGLLVQNLKKGNTALVKRLKEEREEALEKELQWRKRQVEEAGTKLLFPMSMILLLVLVMLMLPAFSGLGI